MKALTICQPYAELIARGSKRIENRTWPTAYRGPLVIHAGKSRDWLDPDTDAIDYPDGDLVFGAFIAIADLVGCRRVEDLAGGLEDARACTRPMVLDAVACSSIASAGGVPRRSGPMDGAGRRRAEGDCQCRRMNNGITTR